MINDFSTGEQEGENEGDRGEGDARNSSTGASQNGTAGARSDLPASIKEIQEMFRPRFEAQDRRMEALAAAQFASRLANATVTHDLPADEALRLLERMASGEIDWPFSEKPESRH